MLERLVARMEVLGPDRGQVVPTLRRLQVAGETVMMREDAEVLVDPLPPQVLDRRGGGRMELATPPSQQRPVRDFLDQGVREPHLVWLPVGLEQTHADELVDLGVRFSPDQLLEQRHRHRTSQHRRGGEHVAGARPERIEPSQDHLLDRRRELDARAHTGRARREDAGSDERADQLGEEERIAA